MIKRVLSGWVVLMVAGLMVGCGGAEPAVCPVTPVQPDPYPRDDIGDLPWIAASPAGDYPSIITLPAAGCWQLELTGVAPVPAY